MPNRVVAIVAFGALLIGCGGAPKYTREKAINDMLAYQHVGALAGPAAECVVDFLFSHVSPGQVKTAIRGGDLSDVQPPAVLQAEEACFGPF